MASGKTCPDCGSSTLVDDSLYSESQLVCTDCGSVVSHGLLTSTRSEEIQGTDVRYRDSTAVDKQPCHNQIRGLQRVRALCRILRFPRVIEESAESLFGRAYEHPSFLHVSLQKKEVLGGSCVLLSSRLHNWHIAMGTICSLLEAGEHAVGAVYSELVKILNVEAPTSSITCRLESHCNQYKLSPGEVQKEFSESTASLVARASQLVELAAETWLVTGRHPVHILAAVVYLAWLSLNPCKARLAVPLARFCRMAKVRMPGNARLRVTELKEVLCRLGKELPWLRGAPVEPRTVLTLTGDILKYRLLLMRKAMRSFKSELLPPPPDPDPEACPDPDVHLDPDAEGPLSSPRDTQVTAPEEEEEEEEGTIGSGKSPPSAMQTQASNLPGREFSRSSSEHLQGQAPPSGDANPNGDFHLDSRHGPAPEEHWAKRHLFVPPCARNPPRKKRRMEGMGPAVTGYEEISDSEIEGYLRTPQEMVEFAEMQRQLMSTDR